MWLELEYDYNLGQILYKLKPNGEIEEWQIIRFKLQHEESCTQGITSNKMIYDIIPKSHWDDFENNSSYVVEYYKGKTLKDEEVSKEFFIDKKGILKKLMENI